LVELPSPFAGKVDALLVEEGQTVEVGTPIISVAGDAASAASEPVAAPVAEAAATVSDTAATVAAEEKPGAVLVGYGTSGHGTSRRRRGDASPAPAAPAAAPAARPASVPAAAASAIIAKPPIRK